MLAFPQPRKRATKASFTLALSVALLVFVSFVLSLNLEPDKVQQEDRTTHVFLASSSPDIRPLFVALNSSLISVKASNHRLKIVAFLPPHFAAQAESLIKELIPHASDSFSVDSTSLDIEYIRNLPGVEPTRKTKRKELADPYNFAAFYIASLPKYSHLQKAVYLDTDVVVQGDLSLLSNLCCSAGTPVAAVEDCSQYLETYINVTRLRQLQKGNSLGSEHRLRDVGKLCVFNRGILVIDLNMWRTLKITTDIEKWMTVNSKADLYFEGVSQPPFLLALLRRYTKLDYSWNVRGLSRSSISAREVEFLESQGMSSEYLSKFAFRESSPFLSPFAEEANILHFNGKHKPWLQRKPATEKNIFSRCGPHGRPCAEYWWHFISDDTNVKLSAWLHSRTESMGIGALLRS